RDARVVRPERLRRAPHHLARGAQQVQRARLIVRDPRREHVALDDRRRQLGALQLLDAGEYALGPGEALADLVPFEQEAREGRGRDRLDLPAQARERSRPERAQHAGVAPLRTLAAGTKLSAQDPPGAL